MSYQLFLGYIVEGTTDKNFLHSIIERTISEMLFKYSNKDIEIITFALTKDGNTFIEQSISAIRKGHFENSANIIFIHADADHSTSEKVIKYKINPLNKLLSEDEELKTCNIVPIIPVHMIEAWMLADFNLFKSEVSTDKTKSQLNLSGNPEQFSDPKRKIIEALKIVKDELPKKRRKELKINDLYQIMGQKIEIYHLNTLQSFLEFYKNLFEVLKKMNLINHNIKLEL